MNGEKMNFKWWIIFWIVFVLVITIAIPYGLEYWVFRSNLYSAIDNSDWVSFLGGYIGSIIGALGIVMTLFFTRKENTRIIDATKAENDKILSETRKENTRMLKASKEANDLAIKSQVKPCIYYRYRDDSNSRKYILQFEDIVPSGHHFCNQHQIDIINIGLNYARNVKIYKYYIEYIPNANINLELSSKGSQELNVELLDLSKDI